MFTSNKSTLGDANASNNHESAIFSRNDSANVPSNDSTHLSSNESAIIDYSHIDSSHNQSAENLSNDSINMLDNDSAENLGHNTENKSCDSIDNMSTFAKHDESAIKNLPVPSFNNSRNEDVNQTNASVASNHPGYDTVVSGLWLLHYTVQPSAFTSAITNQQMPS